MTSRPSIVGPDAGPEAPFPYRMEGKVISGFGRGSKEVTPPLRHSPYSPSSHTQLGIPTANLPVDEAATPWIADMPSGVYYGYASLASSSSHPDLPPSSPFHVFPMVMSVGYNPFYKNTVRSAEVHILHKFSADFYDSHMRLLIVGFIRKELDYSGLEALIADINFDCEVARNSLQREAYAPPKGVVGGFEGTLDVECLTRPL